MKATSLFVLTNLAVMAMIAILAQLFGINKILMQNGIQWQLLFLVSAVFGSAGAFISLLGSKNAAKRMPNMQIIHTPSNAAEVFVYQTVAQMADRLNINMPEVGIFYQDAPNAFATGANKNEAFVAVSSGLLQNMTQEEVAAVIGHEMAHVKNGDMVTMTLLQGVLNSFVYFIAWIGALLISQRRRNENENHNHAGMQNFIVFQIAQQIISVSLGFLANIIIMWFSRYREYHADRGGAALTSRQSMINALKVLQNLQNQGRTRRLPSNMAAFGITSFAGLFATHPPLEKRIEALEYGDKNLYV